jgi:hypothetical protein
MVRALLLALVVLALVPAAGASSRTGFAFGRIGGNIRPFTVTIAADGTAHASGAVTVGRKKLTPAQLAGLKHTAAVNSFVTLPAVTACPGTLPDVAATFIRVGARTVRVHGSCLVRYMRVWRALTGVAKVS